MYPAPPLGGEIRAVTTASTRPDAGTVIVTAGPAVARLVYVADEVLVMSARPGRIIDRIDITLSRPRTYEMMATDVFGRLRERIWQQIRKAT